MSDTAIEPTEPVVDNVPAFKDAFRDAAIASGHMEAETAPERARDEAGRFVAAEAPEPVEEEAPEAPAEAAGEAETPEPEEVLLAGKYKTVEALEQAYQEAQRKLGETSRDVNAYKQLEDEVRQLRDKIGEPAAPQYDPASLESWFAENPHLVPQAAAEARSKGDVQLFDAAMEAWYQLSPRQASAYERQIEMTSLQEQLDAKLGQSMQPLVQQQQAAEYQIAVNNVAEKVPEIKDEAFAEQMMANLQSRPYMLEALRAGSLEVKEQTLADLARITLEGRAPVLAQAQSEQAKLARAEATKAKAEAQVLTTDSTVPPEKTGVAAFREAFRNSPEFRKSAGDNWRPTE